MPEAVDQSLSGVCETYMAPLYWRAIESQRPDARFERVDNGYVEWYDLNLPDVIALRRQYLGSGGGRYHLLACSVLDDTCPEALKAHSQRPFLFLAETVFVYFTESQVKRKTLALTDDFSFQYPGSRIGRALQMRLLPFIKTTVGVFHYRIKGGRHACLA